MNELKKILGPYQPVITRVDNTAVHIRLNTTDEGVIYDAQKLLSSYGWTCICYQTENKDRPQLGVIFKC